MNNTEKKVIVERAVKTMVHSSLVNMISYEWTGKDFIEKLNGELVKFGVEVTDCDYYKGHLNLIPIVDDISEHIIKKLGIIDTNIE